MSMPPTASRLTVLGLLTVLRLAATNPIITDVYTADPSAMVHDGVVYLYTGHDEAAENDPNYRMNEWLGFSSIDMVHWQSHGPLLKVADFTWARSDAFAGDVVERNGKFYWYVPVYHKTINGFAIGVAVADSPLGPFKDARGSALITNDMTTDLTIAFDDIDPKAFVDTDGQAYLFWGNTKCRYVKLKDNMTEMDGSIVTLSLPNYTEAPWVHKKGNLYYLVYATEFPEKFAYATADKVTGPWTYRGVFKSFAQNSNTNHGAVIEFKGRDYLIYHNGALPKGGSYRRSVCVDYLTYNADGTIQTVNETTASVNPAPVLTPQSRNQALAAGGSATLGASATGVGPFTYQWFKDGVALSGQTGSTLTLFNVQSGDLGNYAVTARDAIGGSTTTQLPLSFGAPGRLANLSVRSQAGTGSETLIVGFIVSGAGNKPLLVRGTGPTLTNFALSGVLPDPRLDLYSDSNLIATNDSWRQTTNLAAIQTLGFDHLGSNLLDDKDTLLLRTLTNGGYTAQITGVNGGKGVALVEVFDTDATDPTTPEFGSQPRLVNVSARTQVGTGEGILIAGFIVNGNAPKRVVIRATGPTLAKFGVSGVLADPDLELYRGSTKIAENASWHTSASLTDIFTCGASKLGDFPLDPKEAVLVATLSPGSYTAQVKGANGSTGVALVEVTEWP